MSNFLTVRFFALAACKTFVEDKQDQDSRVIWNLTVPVTQLPKEIPLDPNARLADKKRPTVKKMLGTLAENPKNFIFYNNGILMVVNSINVKGRGAGGGFDVELVLVNPNKDQEEEFIGNGIVNGGHTYLAIMTALEAYEKPLQAKSSRSRKNNPDTGKVDFHNLSQANVQVSVLANISESEIPEISRYRNTSEKVEEFSLKNLAKEWDIIQENLPSKCVPYVAFREGEGKHFDVTDIVRRLACINVKVYPWQGDEKGKTKHPVATFSAYGSLIKKWKKEDFKNVAPLIKDILYIEERIREEYDNQSGLSRFKCIEKKPYVFITGKEFKHTIPITFVFPILAAFRVFIKDDHWERPVEELWDAMGSKLVTGLLDLFRAEGRGNPAFFGRSSSTWSNLLIIPMQLKLTSAS